MAWVLEDLLLPVEAAEDIGLAAPLLGGMMPVIAEEGGSGIGGIVSSIIGNFMSAVGSAVSYVADLIDRIADSSIWDRIGSFIAKLTNPRYGIPILIGMAATVATLFEVAEHHAEIAEWVRSHVANMVNIVYMSIRHVADSLWSYASHFNVNIVINLPIIGNVIGQAISFILTWIVRGILYFIALIVRGVAELVRMVLNGIGTVLVAFVDFLAYACKYIAFIGKLFIERFMLPVALGGAAVSMFLSSLSTLPTSIDQPIEMIDRAMGFLLFSMIYKFSISHPVAVESLSRLGKVSKPSVPSVRPVAPVLITARPAYSYIDDYMLISRLNVEVYSRTLTYIDDYMLIKSSQSIESRTMSDVIDSTYIKKITGSTSTSSSSRSS